MAGFSRLWAMAAMEMRLTRRLVRYWIFLFVAVVFSLALFTYHASIHYFASTHAASFALINPRYFAGSYGANFILLYLLGVIFLAFDVRARDVRERIHEVLDAKPAGNLEMLAGRWLGLLIASWIPMLLIFGFMVGVGGIFGEAPETVSAVLMVSAGALPALGLVIALVYLVSLGLRHRLAAALVLLVAWGLLFSVLSGWIPVPFFLVQAIDITGAYSLNFPSDLSTWLPGWPVVAQRVGYLSLTLGLLLLAALVHPRRDDSRSPGRVTAAAVCTAAGALLVVMLSWSNGADIRRLHHWERVHAARASEAVADLQLIEGRVKLDPGRRLDLDLRLTVAAAGDTSLDHLLLSLNPGLVVERLAVGGHELEFSQGDGLLEFDLPGVLEAGDSLSFDLEAGGLPDPLFAYIDHAYHPLEAKTDEGNVFLFGFENAIYERGLVALPAGCRWLPAMGAEVGRGSPRVHPRDLHRVRIDVEAPAGWKLAGPGVTAPVAPGAGGGEVWRIDGEVPLPPIGLFAGPYAERSLEVEGVTFRALVEPGHLERLAVLALAEGELREYLAGLVRDARELGLPVPGKVLTLVEVPHALRGYGGGWRRDSVQAQPGVVLMRESGLPTARFDVAFEKLDDADPATYEGGKARAIFDRTLLFVRGDTVGGNPLVNAARTLVDFRTAPRGPGGEALAFVNEVLASRLLTGEASYFSTRVFMGRRGSRVIGQAIARYMKNRDEGFAAALATLMTSRPSVWEAALSTSLVDLDPDRDPQKAIDVLTLKGGALSRSLIDALGRERSGALLAGLVQDGGTAGYGLEDYLDLAGGIDPDLAEWLRLGMETTELPAFRGAPAEVYRLEDAADGTPRYQLLVRVANDGAAPGLLRVRADLEGEGQAAASRLSDPIRLDAGVGVEIGMLSSVPPAAVKIEPYLAENRGAFEVPLDTAEAERVRAVAPFDGTRPWSPPPPDGDLVFVDDLDPDIRFIAPEAGGWFRRSVGRREELDHGLPARAFSGSGLRNWARVERLSAAGRYRHTLAAVRAEPGEHRVVVPARLPEAGEWTLEVHYAGTPGAAAPTGSWHFGVEEASEGREFSWKLEFDEPGWYPVETMDLLEGDVEVSITADENTRLLFFDALRWRRTRPPGGGGEVRE
ncbi:MAG: ABC transporter permease [Acidobacteriota bacterium]|nr:ABC transporter permease [Acidobacteriota bacterium]